MTVNYAELLRKRFSRQAPERKPAKAIVMIRMDRELRAKLDQMRRELNISLNELCVGMFEIESAVYLDAQKARQAAEEVPHA